MTGATTTVSAWARKQQKRLDAIVIGSAQDLVDEVSKTKADGGSMRVKTGFLRASLTASTKKMPSINITARSPKETSDNSIGFNTSEISFEIAGFNPGDHIYLGFTAAYARPREYHDGFVKRAAQKWNAIVRKNTAKAKRAGL